MSIFEIVKESKEELRVVMRSNDITLPVLLTNKLWEYGDVKFSGYYKEHPLVDKIDIVVKGKDVKKLLLKAISDLKNDFEAMLKELG